MLGELGARVQRNQEVPGKPVVAVDLSFMQVTDDGLKDIASLTQLQSLDLSETQVTGAGLKDLAHLTQLHELDLTDTQATDEQVNKLKAALPMCKIHH